MTINELLRIDIDAYKSREPSKVYREVKKNDSSKTIKVVAQNKVPRFAEEAYEKAVKNERAKKGVISTSTVHRKRYAQWGEVFRHKTFKVTIWLEYGD